MNASKRTIPRISPWFFLGFVSSFWESLRSSSWKSLGVPSENLPQFLLSSMCSIHKSSEGSFWNASGFSPGNPPEVSSENLPEVPSENPSGHSCQNPLGFFLEFYLGILQKFLGGMWDESPEGLLGDSNFCRNPQKELLKKILEESPKGSPCH